MEKLIAWICSCDSKFKVCCFVLHSIIKLSDLNSFHCFVLHSIIKLSDLNSFQHDFHIRLCSCCSTVTRWMWLVQKELLILPSLQPVYRCVCVAQSLVFYVVFCCALFVFWPLDIVLLSSDWRFLITHLASSIFSEEAKVSILCFAGNYLWCFTIK